VCWTLAQGRQQGARGVIDPVTGSTAGGRVCWTRYRVDSRGQGRANSGFNGDELHVALAVVCEQGGGGVEHKRLCTAHVDGYSCMQAAAIWQHNTAAPGNSVSTGVSQVHWQCHGMCTAACCIPVTNAWANQPHDSRLHDKPLTNKSRHQHDLALHSATSATPPPLQKEQARAQALHQQTCVAVLGPRMPGWSKTSQATQADGATPGHARFMVG
jgi:hypothetical protein